MKKKDLSKIFGTEYPSIEEYQDWILENNPKTFQPWNPPLDSQEKEILSDGELVEKPQVSNSFGPILIDEEEWNSYQNKYLPIEGASLLINNIREAEKEEISNEEILYYINESEKLLKNCISEFSKYRFILHKQVLQVLEKHGISANETINNLKKKNINNLKKNFLEKKDEIFKNLSEWGTTMGDDIIWKIGSDGKIYIKREWFENKEEYNSLQVAIVQNKVEEIKKNPQNWKIFKMGWIDLPWSGGTDYIERKDGKEKYYKSGFNQQQWKEVEKAVEGNFFFYFFQSS